MDPKSIKIMMSNESDNWGTPKWFVEKLEELLILKFNLDPCASSENSKCEKFFTEKEDGLLQDWSGYNVFVNPPYSKIKEWIKKCVSESEKPNTNVIVLVPARTDTKWFHDFCLNYDNNCFLMFVKGRLKFELPSKTKNTAPFPSVVCVFRKHQYKNIINNGVNICQINNKPLNATKL